MDERREWRCEGCGLLLGVKNAGKLELVYKEIQYVFRGDGVVTTRCRRCGRLNDVKVA